MRVYSSLRHNEAFKKHMLQKEQQKQMYSSLSSIVGGIHTINLHNARRKLNV